MLNNEINKRVFRLPQGLSEDRDSKVHRFQSRGDPRVRYAFVLVHRGGSADGRVGVRVAESSQRRPETQSRRSREGAAAAEEPGSSNGGGSGGRGAVVVASGSGNVGAAAESEKGGRPGQANNGAGGEDRAAAAALDDNLAEGPRDPRCGRRRKDRAGESRSTSTMTVDDDGDGGGEAYAAAGNVCWRQRRKIRLAERGVEEDGFWFLPFLCSDRSATDFVMSLICSRSSQTSL
ncbi:hypothetical protein Scep_028240 [Stephania cephalantha]|uniref:Uncharacterized protein n=1 Tax=Stephania cephalantha TaxID=152367 RepID=A0AAP0HHY2_9MAGN